MVFSRNNRDIHSLANILRRTTWGRLCCLNAVGMAKELQPRMEVWSSQSEDCVFVARKIPTQLEHGEMQ